MPFLLHLSALRRYEPHQLGASPLYRPTAAFSRKCVPGGWPAVEVFTLLSVFDSQFWVTGTLGFVLPKMG